MKKNVVIISSVVGVVVFGVVLYALFFNKPENQIAEPSVESETPVVQATPSLAESTPSPNLEPVEGSVSEVQGTPAQNTGGAPGLPTELLELDPNDDTQIVMDRGEIRALTEQFGVASVYERLQYYNREELIADYGLTEELRNFAEALLLVETDPELRMMLVESVYPTYEPRHSDEPFDPEKVDQQLLEILNAPTATPVTAEEWNVRQQIAGNVSPVAAVEMARRSQSEHPDEPSIQVVASANILKYGGSDAPVSGTERQQAVASLVSAMQSPDFESITNHDQRILVYEVLTSVQNDPELYELLREQVERESNPALAEQLQEMLP